MGPIDRNLTCVVHPWETCNCTGILYSICKSANEQARLKALARRCNKKRP